MRPPRPDENPVIRYAKSKVYGLARRIVPSVRERDRLERMIGPIGFWEQIQRYQIDFHRKAGLQSRHRLLDIGCGPLPGGLAFIDFLGPGNYVGVDVSATAISEGYRQLAKAGLADKNPTLVVSSTFGRGELEKRKFDFIWASQILYHLDPGQLHDLLREVSVRLDEEGVFHCDVIGKPELIGDKSQWNGYRFHVHTIQDLANAGGEYGLKLEVLGPLLDFGYPSGPNMGTNLMLAYRHGNRGA